MPAIDFRELAAGRASSPAGENFEGLIRELGKRLGFNPEWSGRGADQGRDLLFTERRRGALGTQELRWLVSCKDFAASGRSATEHDVGSVSDKVRQHAANGFLLATTTTASSGLKAMLDGLHASGATETLVWDRHELEEMLLREENADLIKRHFPDSYSALQRLSSLPQAMDSLRALVPNPVYERIRTVIETYGAENTWLTGELIWPHDRESAKVIDEAIRMLIEENEPIKAANALREGEIEFDAFEAILATLNTFRPTQALALCEALIRAGDPDGSSLFAFKFYVDNHEPTNEEQIALAARLASEDLHHLYAEEISVFVDDEVTTDPARYDAWSDLDALSANTRVTEIYIDAIDLTAQATESRIDFQAKIIISVELEYDHDTSSSSSFPGNAQGHISAHGIFLDTVVVDTRSFYE